MGHRDDLLQGAKRLLARKGYAHITARDLVAESGTNLASIGYHFGSKEALLNAAVLDSFDEWDGEIERAIDARPGDAPADRLEAFLDGVVRGVAANRAVAMASVQAFAQFEYAPELREQLAAAYGRARREIAALLLERDDVDDETARQLGSLALATVNGLVLQWLVDPDSAPSAADLAAALRRLGQPDTD
ncbi:TetR/AcrR family transcriptional regulator [Jiangella anatolica]|uniref:TetR family transcriptional regulator n=1 Tax=Jiangella anatolica TaxID=2670374 RepID=A0A2W2BLU2_9ACTN|nr:TetR/AcrR family transcriptional regulator [Jiangella anatolica]PZF81258.1 TetR family transcriptional regulator [Jiangella anatolica]